MWNTIVAEFDRKRHMTQVNLCQRMMERQVQETDDICAHLNEMALLYEHLSGMGVTLHNKDYMSMVLMSLPETYSTHLKTLMDSTNSSGHKFTAHDFIVKATELFDKWQLRANCNNKHAPKDTALVRVRAHLHPAVPIFIRPDHPHRPVRPARPTGPTRPYRPLSYSLHELLYVLFP